MFGTFIQSLDSFLPNSVSRVKTDSLLAKEVYECAYFFWKCLRFNQFLWDVSPKIKFPFPPFNFSSWCDLCCSNCSPSFSLPVLGHVSKYRGEA